MTVDFEYKRVPQLRVAVVKWKGPYSDRGIRSHFEKVAAWAKAHGLATGRWVFREPADGLWEVGIEVRGRAKGGDGVTLRTLPASLVASAQYDPETVAPRVIWHGLNDWLRWQRKERKIKRVVAFREIYSGNPWSSKAAWSKVDVQFVVKR